jgi:hypothetical protein
VKSIWFHPGLRPGREKLADDIGLDAAVLKTTSESG